MNTRFEIVKGNGHGEYCIVGYEQGKETAYPVVDGLRLEEAEMELRMLNGDDVSFEEYTEMMS